MACCDSIIKNLFGLVTLAIFLGGCGLLGVGIYSLVNDGASFSDLIDNEMLTGTAIVLIVAGSLIVLVSFFGCCGAFKESKCMLGTFFCLVLVLFTITAAGAVTGFVLGGSAITDGLETVLTNSLKKYETDDTVKKSWDTVQRDFECCGVKSSSDYGETDSILPDVEVPASCGDHTDGCLEKTIDFIDKNSKLFGAIALVVAAFLFMSMFFSCCIMRSIN